MELLFAEAVEPALTVVGKGHGRLESRRVWVSGELAGYTGFPGLASVVMVRQETLHLAQGRHSESVQYGVSSLPELEPARALSLLRGHWGIENRHFHVKDDSFREDRQVLQCHDSGAVLSLLSNAALALLHGQCELWRSKEPLTGRAQRLCAHPHAILLTPDPL